jgi:hypothetical protein
MVMVGAGSTGTIAVSKKTAWSSRSKPLLWRHLHRQLERQLLTVHLEC